MKYKIIVDKQSRVNPSDEKRTYEIDIEELRRKGNIADSFVFTREEAYVMRRLSLSEYHVLSVLPEPIKEPLEIENIELFKGDNYIYIIDMTGNKFYAEYILDNDFNKTFATKIEMFATIETLADSINLEVSKKVGNNEIISKINMSPEEILINGDKINIDGKAVRFSTKINQTFGPYTEADKERIKNIILGAITATGEDYSKYDIDGDGRISSIDLLRVTKAVQGNGYFNETGIFTIDPYSAQKSVKVYRDGVPVSILSILGNYFSEINLGGSIDFLEDKTNKISGYINTNGFSLNKKSETEIESSSYIGITNYAGEDVGAMSLSSKYGSIFVDTSSINDGACIALSRKANYIQTLIKSTGITTPVLTQTSREETKKNFEKFENGLDIVKATDIYKYNLKSEEDTKKKHIGFVIGDNYKYAHEITAEDDKGKEIGVDTYSMISVLWKAVQEQQEQIEKMQNEINKLKEVQNGKN